MMITGIFKSKNCFKLWILLLFCLSASPVYAIPSPELVIGSVSSISQLLAVGFAMASGMAAAFGAKLGLKRKEGGAQSPFLVNAVALLVLLFSASLGVIFYQNHQIKQTELARLQATLVRPAQFKGTKIQDKDLKETSFAAQSKSKLGITTAQANKLLQSPGKTRKPLLIDVREDAEFQMGTIPGARHIRFPDMLNSGLDMTGKKVILMCHNGNRSSETCKRLAAKGIDCRFIAGGLEKWIVEKRPFTDSSVRGLSDLRAIPDYKNKDTLINTVEFKGLIAQKNMQIVDTRYPKDFAVNHLPNAINIPLRKMPTPDLNTALSKLGKGPTVVACYDRRSCFMGQVLGLEMAKRKIDYKGRYTTPWDYFVPAAVKPHIKKWLAEQNKSLWSRTIDTLAIWLLWVSQKTHILFGIFLLSLASRLFVLPIAVKSEKDQIAMAAHKEELAALKTGLKDDPARRARAVHAFHNKLGLTPVRNMLALLFLPVMMLGLKAIEHAAPSVQSGFLWVPFLAAPDQTYLFPAFFAVLVGVYLHITLANTFKRRVFCWGCRGPAAFCDSFSA